MKGDEQRAAIDLLHRLHGDRIAALERSTLRNGACIAALFVLLALAFWML